jgi:hypothetical protein
MMAKQHRLNPKALNVKTFAELLENAAGSNKGEIRDALAVVGIQSAAPLTPQNPISSQVSPPAQALIQSPTPVYSRKVEPSPISDPSTTP